MLRILIAEDEHLVRIGIKNCIDWEAAGMRIAGDADNGRQALELYRALSPDIILTDLKMPGMGGLELMREIRASDRRTRFIILTCFDEFQLVKEAMRLDATAYILKLTSEREEIEEALEKARAELGHFQVQTLGAPYVDRRAIREQVFRDFLVYGKIPPEGFREFLELSEEKLPLERLRILMVRFPDYAALQSRERDPLGYRLKNVVADLLQELLQGLPGQAYGGHGEDYLLLVCFAGMRPEEEDAALDSLVVRIKEGVLQYLNQNVLIGVSSAANGIEPLPQKRDEAVRALEQRVPLPYKVTAALDFLKEHYRDNISLQSAADHVGVSPNYLGHLFLRHLGTPFTERLNQERIEHAKALLNNPQYLVYEVGSRVGIDNTTYFTRLFKRYAGTTPRAYRKERGI